MRYELVCGLETHVELSTATKIFCGCSTAFGGAPNTHCCPVCTGQPGALPVLNRRVMEYAIRAGLAANCEINRTTHLDRKNYCYPDLPKAYQISQFDKPIAFSGYIELDSGKRVRIKRIHVEEDAGKLVHERGYTFVDYNRGGVPLVEIVSEPDISSPEEAREYIEKMQQIMRAIGVSDCKMQEGSLRCDANISVREEGTSGLSTRTEIKNMNSVSFLEKAIAYEYRRQVDVLSSGGKIEQATLRFDEKTGETYAMRTKEDAQDYRYFPEPDILTVTIREEDVEEQRKAIPALPLQRQRRYVAEGASESAARLVSRYKAAADFLDEAVSLGASCSRCANLIVGTIFAALPTEEDKENFAVPLSAEQFSRLVSLLDQKKINVTMCQMTLSKMIETGKGVDELLSAEDLAGVGEDELRRVCREAIEANPKACEEYRAGKEKAAGALYGYIKRATGGKADIEKAGEIIKEMIKK